MEIHSHHSELLQSLIVGGRRAPRRVEAIRLLDRRVGASTAKLVGPGLKVKRIGGGMSVPQAARIRERSGVNFHSEILYESVDRCECNTASSEQRERIGW